jgi:hypothetical protein
MGALLVVKPVSGANHKAKLPARLAQLEALRARVLGYGGAELQRRMGDSALITRGPPGAVRTAADAERLLTALRADLPDVEWTVEPFELIRGTVVKWLESLPDARPTSVDAVAAVG